MRSTCRGVKPAEAPNEKDRNRQTTQISFIYFVFIKLQEQETRCTKSEITKDGLEMVWLDGTLTKIRTSVCKTVESCDDEFHSGPAFYRIELDSNRFKLYTAEDDA